LGQSITYPMAEVMVPRGLFEKNPVRHRGAPSVAAGTMLSIDIMAATSSCRRTGAPEGGCSGLKLGRFGDNVW
jgi:hypothetical protein